MYESDDTTDGGILASTHPRSSVRIRATVAGALPFFLRAWWLRDRLENASLVFGDDDGLTLPLWSLHSDPICDAANSDVYEL
jgi:hypothetical protein